MSYVIEKATTKIIAIEVPAPNILKSINFYLVQKNESLFLIDAGLDHDIHWEHLEKALHTHGLHVDNLTAILLTHHHFDHLGLVYRIAERKDIPVYIQPYAIPKLKGDPEFLYKNYRFFRELLVRLNTGDFGIEQVNARYQRQMNKTKTAIDWNLKEIHTDTLFDFQVIDIPGHAPEQVAFYLPEEDIIFLGDVLIDHLRSNAFVELALDGSKVQALEEHIQSLEKIITLNPDIAFSGHGKMIKEPSKLAVRRLAAIEAKANSFLSMIDAGISTGSEIVKQRHPNKYEELFFTLLSDALSFLDYLEAKGKLIKKEINGIWHWQRNSR